MEVLMRYVKLVIAWIHFLIMSPTLCAGMLFKMNWVPFILSALEEENGGLFLFLNCSVHSRASVNDRIFQISLLVCIYAGDIMQFISVLPKTVQIIFSSVQQLA